MLSITEVATAFFVAGFFVVVAVPLVRILAKRIGAMDHPGGRRVHLDSVPRLGGVAVVLGILAALTVVVGRMETVPAALGVSTRLGWIVLGGATLLLLAIGVRDDLLHVRAQVKLAGELAAATAVVLLFPVSSIDFGLFEVPGSVPLLSAAIVVLWMAAVTNAYNMVDGLDGLAGGVGAIAAAAMAVGAWLAGSPGAALSLVAVSGALTGFLFHNRHPARIFLGDAGSLPIGFLLAALGFIGFRSGGSWYAVPAVIALALPLLDLSMAIVRRFLDALQVYRHDDLQERFELKLHKAPRLFSPDGRHIHHRLISLGLSRRWTVVVLYAVGFAFALLSLATDRWRHAAPVAFVLVVSVLAFLGSRWLYRELRILQRGLLLPLYDTRLARNRVIHAMFDLVALALAFMAGRRLVEWDWNVPVDEGSLLLRGGAAAFTAIAVLWAAGVYQFSFRRAGQWVVSRTTLAVGLAMLAAAAVDTLVFAQPLHWASWVLTGYLSLTVVLVPRMSYRVLDSIHQRSRQLGRRVAIFGAGRGGNVTLRELLENRRAGMIPVGFVDDDPALWNKVVEGLEIFAGGDRLLATLAGLDVDILVISSGKVPRHRLAQILETCEALGIEARKVMITMGEHEPVADISEPIPVTIRGEDRIAMEVGL